MAPARSGNRPGHDSSAAAAMGLMEQIKETEADIQACVAKKPLNTQHLGRL
eukprot:COSAG04_NODE_16406_length_500_cov_0.673317_1_plen_50_part_10